MTRTALLISLAAGLALSACAPTTPTPADPADTTALDALRPDAAEPPAPSADDLADLAAASAAALDELYAAGTLTPPPRPQTTPDQAPQIEIATLSADTEPTPPETEPPPPPSLDERVAKTAAELAVLLRERAEAGSSPAAELPVLAALDTLGVDGLSFWLDPTDPTLTPHDRRVAEQLRDLIADTARDPDRAPRAFADAAESIGDHEPLRIARATLCTRVEGFGRYTPIASDAVLAGRDHRFIIYTELESFRATPLDADGTPLTDTTATTTLAAETYRVSVSQELLLYHDADGLLAWRRPAETTTYEARSRVRDFFLVDPVRLPRTLTVGAYHLKVVTRDEATGAVDEAILPIRVVADPALARR